MTTIDVIMDMVNDEDSWLRHFDEILLDDYSWLTPPVRPLANIVRSLRIVLRSFREWRKASLLAQHLRFKDLQAFRCCSRVVWQATTLRQCDSGWVRALFAVEHVRGCL